MKSFQTKQEQVYESLRSAIVSGELAPGERINIRQLARQFEVSEIPVREALKALAGENLIQIAPYAGAMVSPISATDISELGEIRLRLEPWGTGLAAPHLTQGDLGELAAHMEEMEEALGVGDMIRFAQADRAFHGLIFSRCPNRRLGELLSNLWVASERNILGLRRLPDHAALSQKEHHVLFDALQRHDGPAAEEAARQHRLGLIERLRALVEGHLEAAGDEK